ncbi:MAG TPA: hypothetical protein VFP19_03820, partial [Candidatus Limnocylindrales bacterium]|nr:hypothetical protein [Candidatus Limnocylindrales bacterium]
MSWRDLEAGAPEIAEIARAQMLAHRIALLGTIRPEGWPRIAPIEPGFVAGELILAIMASPKVEDLRREPRCVVHSLVVDGSGTEPEVKLSGRAVATAAPAIRSAAGTWWGRMPDATVALFLLEIEEAVVVSWRHDDGDRMRVRSWRRGGQVTD